MTDVVALKGALLKKRTHHIIKSWDRRHFEVKEDCLVYYHMTKTTGLPRKAIKLNGARVEALPSWDRASRFPFEIIFPGKSAPLRLAALTTSERDNWLVALRALAAKGTTR